MIFKPEFIPLIIAGRKVQTRRIIKQGESAVIYTPDLKYPNVKFIGEVIKNKKTKWFVNQTLAVQSGGKSCVWYCPECKKRSLLEEGKIPLPSYCFYCKNDTYNRFVQPLRIRITAIRKERFQEITEQDVKREGFNSRIEFMEAFTKINKEDFNKSAREYSKLKSGKSVGEWTYDREVWVLDFSVVK